MRANLLFPLAAVAAGLLLASPLRAEKNPDQAWNEEHAELSAQIARLAHSAAAWRERLKAEALDQQALVTPQDKDPLDVVLRRTFALLRFFRQKGEVPPRLLDEFDAEWKTLSAAAKSASQPAPRSALFTQVCRLRRKIALANPLLDFDSIVCMLEQPGEERIVEQARAVWRGHSSGGGPLVVRNFKSRPRAEIPLAGLRVSAGPWAGRELTGKFSGLELSYDAHWLFFAATTSSDAWRLFKFDLAARQLVQLTDGPWDDFDPCVLPSGRIVFTSTRRGGIGRCGLTPQSLAYTLHSMEADGSDIVPLSFHEGNEWQPSVNHQGKIVYTRWDYVDRHWGTAHHFWECFPDGRDPRTYHGNYPLPRSAMPAGAQPEQFGQPRLVNGRFLRPDAEMSIRAVPGSPKYTATAVGHHEGFSGSLLLIDTRIPDDGRMSQVKRITPEYFFPEVEPGAEHAYGTAWPLSEDFYLCNFRTGLCLLDRFGNREVIYDPGRPEYRVRDPFPLRLRSTPPALPVMTWQGTRAAQADHHRAVISVQNVYAADEVGKLPGGTKVKWMRIVEVIPQLLICNCCKVDLVSFASDSIGRIPLGVVPVEEDGSVYCEAPVGKPIYFQLLDEKGMAVQSMRSATYVHPGERLSCLGCHEDKWKPAPTQRAVTALRRPPSKITQEIEGGAIPFNFIQLVKQPVFDKQCVACHRQHPPAPDMSYASLARFDWVFSYPGEEPALSMVGVGGSRTTPGRFGARASGIMKSLATKDYHKGIHMSPDQWRRLTLWLDLNSNQIGWISDDWNQIVAQREGQALWPLIDVDRRNPSGVEVELPVGIR